MRFFSNETQDDDTDDKAGRSGDATTAVPQQRAGSPWRHDTDPAPQPTAVGTSTVAGPGTVRPDDDPDRTDRIPDGVDDDRKRADIDKTGTTDKNDTTTDYDAAAGNDTTTDYDTAAGNDTVAEDDDTAAEVERRKDDAVADAVLDDRGSFDDPHLTQEIGTRPEAAPVATPAAETPADAGPLPFFPAADTQPLRDRWRDVQLRFVDDPKGATAEAAGLVDEGVDKLAQALRTHRGSFAKGTDDTEALRVELRSYRDILDRLLGL